MASLPNYTSDQLHKTTDTPDAIKTSLDTSSDRTPLENTEEILDSPPASIYSSGILFPDSINPDSYDRTVSLLSDQDTDPDVDSDDDIDGTIVDSYEITEISQLYPSSMGFTFCLEKGVDWGSVELKITTRCYSRITQKNIGPENSYMLLIECNSDFLQQIIDQIKNKMGGQQYFKIIESRAVKFLQVVRNTKDLVEKFESSFKEIESEHVNRFIEKLDRLDVKIDSRANLHTVYKGCFNAIIRISENRKELIKVCSEIEMFMNAKAHLVDLLKIINFEHGRGLWKCKPIEIIKRFSDLIEVEAIKTPVQFLHRNYSKLVLYNEKLDVSNSVSMAINLRITHSNNQKDKCYIKLQVVNASTQFKGKPESGIYFSVVQDEVNEKCFFGTKVSITSSSLLPMRQEDELEFDGDFNEVKKERILYREFEEYAIGHGCSVNWKIGSNGEKTVHSEYLPIYDIPDVDTIPKNKSIMFNEGEESPASFEYDANSLRFKWLSTFSDVKDCDILKALHSFIDTYDEWIKINKVRATNDSSLEAVIENLDQCLDDKDRMRRNVNEFLSQETKMHSFRLMNSAMFMQLWHSAKVKKNDVLRLMEAPNFIFDKAFYAGQKEKIFDNTNVSWRPFQLAFILLNLDGIFEHEEFCTRNEQVDLVWFPTGGGKTEAYLGLIALSIIHRRKTHCQQGGGTTVIMRYTLRLLALQQFQRATTLIMALELLRRWDEHILGSEPISIGLWLGQSSLPNKRTGEDSATLESQLKEFVAGRQSQIPFDKCLWCGSSLEAIFRPDNRDPNEFLRDRLYLKCSNALCNFNYGRPDLAGRRYQGPIPAVLCDEDIYMNPPTLLFGTVDKFAQLAHKASSDEREKMKDSRRLFGRGVWASPRPINGYLPPELIIQDELHLLLGPLGTAVALFETAIDRLCSHGGKRPKIISSTATTKNTELQIMALYDRKLNIFPKPGTDVDDSFFSFYKRAFTTDESKTAKYISKRRYIGVQPTGRAQVWSQMRLLAILLAHRAFFLMKYGPDSGDIVQDKLQKVVDHYHTVTAYFNSLKDLGRTDAQIHSYLIKEVRKVFNRVIRPQKLLSAMYTFKLDPIEMTGRIAGHEVKSNLERLQEPWTPICGNSQERFKKTSDIVLATNMISVGIDVSRLNIMLVNSMPRNIAEYIQATSRVARESLGVVITLHNPFRARDISHYERFIGFHSKIYNFVEPISITPYTPKAIEKFFPLYFATVLRHLDGRFINRKDARNISQLQDNHAREQFVEDMLQSFWNRYERLQEKGAEFESLFPPESKGMLQDITNKMIDDWIRKYQSIDQNEFVFNSPARGQSGLYVEIDEYESKIHSDHWVIPQALRMIEPKAAIRIKLR